MTLRRRLVILFSLVLLLFLAISPMHFSYLYRKSEVEYSTNWTSLCIMRETSKLIKIFHDEMNKFPLEINELIQHAKLNNKSILCGTDLDIVKNGTIVDAMGFSLGYINKGTSVLLYSNNVTSPHKDSDDYYYAMHVYPDRIIESRVKK